MILRIFPKGADGKLLEKILADLAELSINKALERLNVSRETQKIILNGQQETAVRELLADMMLWQVCPQGLAKAITEDNS